MKSASRVLGTLFVCGIAGASAAQAQSDIFDQVEHHYVDNGDVRIHYVSLGEGPLVVFVHGFPDFWYSWRDQMEALKDDFRVVAVDQRGYNLSGQPEGVDALLGGLPDWRPCDGHRGYGCRERDDRRARLGRPRCLGVCVRLSRR